MTKLTYTLSATFATLAFAALGAAGADNTRPAAKDRAAAKQLQLPKPAPEIRELASTLVGRRQCDGKAWMPDGTEHVMTGVLRTRVDYDGFWIHETWDGKMDKLDFRYDAYITYDQQQKKWRRVVIDSLGGQMTGTSDGMTRDGKLAFDTLARGVIGSIQLKELYDTSEPRVGMKMSAERSLDEGKTWQKDMAVICKPIGKPQ